MIQFLVWQDENELVIVPNDFTFEYLGTLNTSEVENLVDLLQMITSILNQNSECYYWSIPNEKINSILAIAR